MAKIIVFNMISVDGFFAGPNGEIDWHNVDAEFNDFAINQLDEAGTLLFGRVTYDLMANYWPSKKAVKDDPIVAKLMNYADKIVFSGSIKKAGWKNTTVINKIQKTEIKKLKLEKKEDIFVFGSGQIVQKFAELGLTDEYRLMVNPIVLGKGKPLFIDRLKLRLLKTKEFKNGNVLLSYRPI